MQLWKIEQLVSNAVKANSYCQSSNASDGTASKFKK